MKKIVYGLIIITILFSALSGIMSAEGNKTNKKFIIHKDCSISEGKHTFKNFDEYIHSDFFRENHRRCLVKRLPENLRQKQFRSAGDCSEYRTVIKSEYWPVNKLIVPVVFHIIHKTDGTGNISDDKVRDQIKVLNEDFSALKSSMGSNGFNTHICFALTSITRTANDKWFNDTNEKEYKEALGWDQNKFLNIYSNSASGYLGYSYYPQDSAGTVYDGIVVLYETVGGRNQAYGSYNHGRTLVHEAGHYFGLAHTFEGGCFNGYNAGDLIDDTEPEADAHYNCVQTYSCNTPDAIHNYMNYTPDECMNQFTPEQGNRMVCSLLNYRPELSHDFYPPADVSVEKISNNLIFREEVINKLTWKINPENTGKIIKYYILRKSPESDKFEPLTEIPVPVNRIPHISGGIKTPKEEKRNVYIPAATDILTFEDRDCSDINYLYMIFGESADGKTTIPVIKEAK